MEQYSFEEFVRKLTADGIGTRQHADSALDLLAIISATISGDPDAAVLSMETVMSARPEYDDIAEVLLSSVALNSVAIQMISVMTSVPAETLMTSIRETALAAREAAPE